MTTEIVLQGKRPIKVANGEELEISDASPSFVVQDLADQGTKLKILGKEVVLGPNKGGEAYMSGRGILDKVGSGEKTNIVDVTWNS